MEKSIIDVDQLERILLQRIERIEWNPKSAKSWRNVRRNKAVD